MSRNETEGASKKDARCQMPDASKASRVMLSGSERSERSGVWYLGASVRALCYCSIGVIEANTTS
ncbi:MAG: hypothetical protein ABFR53_13410, partial [Actinomycetota bacterium]